MDSYTKDLHLQAKDYDSDIPNNDLSPLEGDHREARPHFNVDDPLEVQLRFELGSLVDAQVLLDTHGPRESHWDFVRQEQGRFQTSSEDSTALLAHVKQDDLKSFDNCEGWARSTSQMDTQLFMDTHDDVSMIAAAFGGKDRSVANLVEDDRSLVPPSYGHREEATERTAEEKKASESDKPERNDDGAVGATQIERPGTPVACTSTTEFSPNPPENTDIQTVGNNENREAKQSAADLVIEPVMNSEHRNADNAASVTVSDPPCDVSVKVNVHQDLPLDCSKENQIYSNLLEASSTDAVEVSVQMAAIIPVEDANMHPGSSINAQDARLLVEESKRTAVETKVGTEPLSVISESMVKNLEAGHLLSSKAEETKVETEPLSVISETMGKNLEAGHLLSSKAEETRETGTAHVSHPCHIFSHSSPTGDIVSHSSPNIENETPGAIPNTLDNQVSSDGTCVESERALQISGAIAEPDSDEKQSASELPCPEVECMLKGTEAAAASGNSMSNLEDRSTLNKTDVSNDESVNKLDVASTLRSCKELEKVSEAKGEASDGQEHQTHVAAVEQADTVLAGDTLVEAVKFLTTKQQVMCLERAASVPQQDVADVSTHVENPDNTRLFNEKEPTSEIILEDAADVGPEEDLSKVTPVSSRKEIDLGAQKVRDRLGTPQVSADIGTKADLSEVTPANIPKGVDFSAQEAKNCSGTPQVSAAHCDADALKPANYSAQPKDHAAIKDVDSKQHGVLRTPTVLTVKDTSLRNEPEAQSTDESTGQEKLPTDASEALTQELSMKHHDTDQSTLDYSNPSAKPVVLNEEKGLTESTHPGGVLHVMLDVHKEAATGDSLPKEGSFPDQIKIVESKKSVSVPKSNPGDAMRKDSTFPEDAAAGAPHTHVVGLTGVSIIAGFQEDEQPISSYSSPQQEKASKRKSDPSNRNNRLKDSARASLLQGRSDEEQKDAGKEGLGKRKSTPKTAAPKKITEVGDGFSSPLKSVSTKSSAGKKKEVSLPIVQDAIVSTAGKDGSQPPASRNKSVFTFNARQQAFPDVNGSEAPVPAVLPTQPFTEPQQVQLRAQILVYGSLIQGAAPEEALMVAAFSNVIGAPVREAGRDLDASGRMVWEKQWQGAVDRIQAKSSRDTLRDSSRASGALVSNVSVSSAKASEAGLKSNSSSGATSSMVDVRNVAGLHARVSDVSAAKSHPSHPRQTADLGPMNSVSRSNQSVAVVVSPGPSTSMPFRSVPSSLSENVNQSSKARVDLQQGAVLACYPTPPLSENLSQSSKARADLQQAPPPAYYPPPPLGSFLTGAPPWLSTATFPGSWIPQTQGNVYNTPPSLFSHPQAIVTSDQAQDLAMARRNTAPSAGPVGSVNPIVPALYTPVVGTVSVTPTPAADLGQKRQSTSDARPRKRKKTQSEIYVSLTDGVPNASFVAGTSNQITPVTDFPSGQAGLLMSSPVYLPSLPAPESLAMVVAKTQTPKTVQETSIVAVNANKCLTPDSSNIRNANISSTRAVEQQLGKSMGLQNSASQLAQAEASAEEAASLAASAVRESESFWSQLKAQRSAGLASDVETQLVSSAIAMATAASVAKAAAAAARAAYEAAVQAKIISEDTLGSSKHGHELESSRLLQDKAENSSQVWAMPGSCNSIMEAAKIASKKRLEAASAASARAQNFESVLRAAEIATNAVSQVGSVISMGESLPFTLEMLMEAGPEGLQRLLLGSLEDKDNTLESPGKKGTPPNQKGLIENEKKLSKISAAKEAPMQREAQVASWTTESVVPARSEFDARINADLGVGLMTEFSTQNIDDHLALSMPASRQGLSPVRLETGLQEVSIIDNQIMKGSLVEVMSNEKGLRGVWFSARVQNIDGGKVFVLYDDLLSDDGFSPLEEWIQLKGSPSKAPRIRLAHPNTNISFEGTRKRRREALGNHKWSVGDRVDAWMRDGWWEGEIKEIIEDGESKAKVFFPCDGDTSLMKTSKLRPSLVWSNGQWVLCTDAKQGKGDGPKGMGIPHEGETPIAKRQRTEKGQLINISGQKLLGTNIPEMAGAQKEGTVFDSASLKIPTDFKGFTADGTDKSKQQGSKVMFGIPRPTKKRKLMEVSKHYNLARGVRSTTTFNSNVTNSKHEEVRSAVVGFTPGSTEGSRLESSKTKKKVLPSQKLRISETVNSKSNALRSKKDRPFPDSKPLARKNALAREGLPGALKNTDGKVVGKKKLPLENSQLGSEEQTDGFPIIDISSQKIASPSSATTLEASNCSSLPPEESGKEPSHTVQRSGKPIEKQTPHSGKDSGKDSANATQARESKQASVKEKLMSQQAKDKSKQTLNPAIGNKHSSKKKEIQPSDTVKDSKEPSHSKENQKQSMVLAKESESHPAHEGDKQRTSPVSSREKRPTSPANDSEKQPKETEKGKDAGKPGSETWEPRRTSRKIQPTSKLLEGLQTAPKLGKNSSSHDKGSRAASKAAHQQ